MSSMRAPAASRIQPIFLSVCSCSESVGGVEADRAGAQVRVDADDVGLARRDRQHALAAAADEDRHVRLRRLRVRRVVGDAVVLAVIA